MSAGARFVVCGMGRLGRRIVLLLERLGHEVTVISRSAVPDPPDPAERVRVLVGDARDERVLEEAGLGSARALIVVTDDDLGNVSIALHARKVCPAVNVVLRMFDDKLAEHLRTALGLHAAFSASALAAPAYVAAALGATVHQTFEAGGEGWVVAEGGDADEVPTGKVVVEGGVFLARRSRGGPGPAPRGRSVALLRGLRESWAGMPRGLRLAVYSLLALVAASVGVFHYGLRLSFLDAFYFVVSTVTTTGYGDFNLQNAPAPLKLYGTLVMVSGCALFAVLFSVITDLLVRTRLGDVVARGMASQKGHVVIAGLGHVGIRVLRELARHGDAIVAVERDEDGLFVGAAKTLAPVVAGDAGAEETLRRAGVAGAKAVLALTDDDLTNLSIALAARRANPDRDLRVVARIFDATLASRLSESLRIDAVLSISDSAAPTFVGAALDEGVVRGFVLGDRFYLVVRRKIGAPPGTAAGEAGGPGERVLLRRKGKDGPFEPLAGGSPAAGDEVIAVRWIEMGPAEGPRGPGRRAPSP